MKKIFFILFIILAKITLHAQNVNFEWAKQMGGTDYEIGTATVIDASGNVYTTGVFEGTADFDPGAGVFNLTSFGSHDIFVSKLDPAGNFIWAKQMGGAETRDFYFRDWSLSIALDASGNVYTTGWFGGTADFDPGTGVFNLICDDFGDMFVSKLDAAGNFVWAKQMGGTGVGDATSIATDMSGNVYTTGSFFGTVDFDPGAGVFNLTDDGDSASSIFVSKLDATGNFVWAKQMGGKKANISEAIAIDASGSVYTTGFFYGTTDFDPGAGEFNLNTFGETDIFVSKLDAAGNFVWAKQMGGNEQNNAYSLAIDASGNVYTTGYFMGTTDFDPGAGSFTLAAKGADIFISKLDAAGNFAWAKQMTGTEVGFGVSITVDASGNVYSTGYFGGTVDFDPGVCVFNLSSLGPYNIFVSKLDAVGNFHWAKQMGGAGESESQSIVVSASGDVYTAGAFSGTVDFDPGNGTYNLSWFGGGLYDVFVHKMSPCTNSTDSTITVSTCSSYTLNCSTYTSSGVYTQIIENTAGCDSIITLNLTISAITASPVNASACNSYLWNGQTITSSGIYIDTLIAANGCDSIITLNLNIRTTTSSPVNVTTCNSYFWNGQTITGSGVYTDTLIAANGCDSIVTLQLTIKPISSSAITETICPGQNYSGYTSSGIYIDTFVAANGCDSLRTLQLIVSNVPVPDLGPDKGICFGDSLVLYPGQFDNYRWQDGSTKSSITVKERGLYSVVVSDGCDTARDEILVNQEMCNVYFPSAFTPNNDGKNDLFKISGYNLSSYNLVVYNRWGQKVFQTNDYTKGWDGKINGKLSETGVFVWFCNFKKSNSPGNIEKKGTVLLIR